MPSKKTAVVQHKANFFVLQLGSEMYFFYVQKGQNNKYLNPLKVCLVYLTQSPFDYDKHASRASSENVQRANPTAASYSAFP